MGQWKDLLLQRGKLLEVQRQEICSGPRNAGFSEEFRRMVVWLSQGAGSPAGEFLKKKINSKLIGSDMDIMLSHVTFLL